ncbi:MAG: hypothetical protein ACREN7_10160 [Candidatus Dormibacteria bacterium]
MSAAEERPGESATWASGKVWRWRALGLARSGWGVFLLVAPDRAKTLLGAPSRREASNLARVLGGRQVLQGVVELLLGPRSRRVGLAVDTLHGMTGLFAAASAADWRRAGLTDAAIALGFIAAESSL